MDLLGIIAWLFIMVVLLTISLWAQQPLDFLFGKFQGEWLSFWGTYFGAVVTIGGSFLVWFCQHLFERRTARKKARPYLSFDYRITLNKNERVYANKYIVTQLNDKDIDRELVQMSVSNDAQIRIDTASHYEKHALLELNNLGPYDMYNCTVALKFINNKRNHQEIFQIANIEAKSSAILAPTPIFKDYTNTDFFLDKLTVVYYTTENEKISSVFNRHGNENLEMRPANSHHVFGVCSNNIKSEAVSSTQFYKVNETTGPADPTVRIATNGSLPQENFNSGATSENSTTTITTTRKPNNDNRS